MDTLEQVYVSSPLLVWLLSSVLAYGMGTNLLWLIRSREGRFGPTIDILVQVARFLFYLGVPYLALGGWPRDAFQGLLSLKDLGFVGFGLDWPLTRWLEAVALALGLGLAALILLVLAWRYAIRSASGVSLSFPPQPWWSLLVDGLYNSVHWAFYRGALVVLRGDLYAGVFLGLALVYVEWSFSPFWRRGWRMPSRAAGQWLRAAQALVAALIFLLTRNLWVCLGIYWGLELSLWAFGRSRVEPVTSHDSVAR